MMGICKTTDLEKIVPPWEWDKLLFAEDLVSYFMRKLLWNRTPFGETDVAPRSDCCRNVVQNGFSEYVRRAVDIIQTTLDYRIRHRFIEIALQHQISYDAYVQYASDVRRVYFSAGNNDVIQFLKYCVFQSVLAVYYYRCNHKKAPDMATGFIFKAFPVKVMTQVTWETLQMASKSYVNEYENENTTSDLNEIKSPVTENVTCECFLLKVSGRSFRTIFKKRESQLTRHFKVCLGIDSPSEALACITEPMPETPKQSTGVSDFLNTVTEPQSKDCNVALTDPILSHCNITRLLGSPLLAELFGTDMGVEHFELPAEYQEDILSVHIQDSLSIQDSLQMYGETTEKHFGSETALQGNEVPAASSQCNSSDGYQQMSSAYDPLQVYRDKMERFFGSQIQFQRDDNSTAFPRTTLDLEHRRASSARNVLQTESEKSQDFFSYHVELPEQGNFELVTRNNSNIEPPQMLTVNSENINYLTRLLRKVQMQRIVSDFFRFQDEIVPEQSECTEDSNAPAMPANPNQPNINYDFLISSLNDQSQYRREEAIRCSGISKPESTASQNTETLSIKSPEVRESTNNLNAKSLNVADMIENLTIQDVSDASSDKDVKPPNFKT